MHRAIALLISTTITSSLSAVESRVSRPPINEVPAAHIAGPRPDGLKPAPKSIHVALHFDRTEFLLGEDIRGRLSDVEPGRESRAVRARRILVRIASQRWVPFDRGAVDAGGNQLGPPVANWPDPTSWGGPITNMKLSPGESPITALADSRSRRREPLAARDCYYCCRPSVPHLSLHRSSWGI
jgi:hypothetical protein